MNNKFYTGDRVKIKDFGIGTIEAWYNASFGKANFRYKINSFQYEEKDLTLHSRLVLIPLSLAKTLYKDKNCNSELKDILKYQYEIENFI